MDERRSTAEASSATSGDAHAKDSYVGTLEDAVLHNTSQFHKWHSELEAACASETEEKYKRYADLLNSHAAACETILAKASRGGGRAWQGGKHCGLLRMGWRHFRQC